MTKEKIKKKRGRPSNAELKRRKDELEKDTIIKPKMYLRVTLDLPISYEEASFIKETFIKEYECREITLIPSTKDDEINSEIDIAQFESVDEIVAKEIEAIDSDSFDRKKLLDIYRDLGRDD